jgi:Uma2 family endonuclease
MEDKIIEQLFEAPQLRLYYNRIGEVLESEQQRRQEFYVTMTEGDKVEFINGAIIMHSPVKLHHNHASFNLAMLLKAFVDKHNLGFVGHEKILVSLTRNDYEPDICFFGCAKASQFTPEQMQFPAPDFVAEILSPSTEERDRGVKYQDYAAHGVAEYWLVDPESGTLEQHIAQGDRYDLRTKARTGIVSSVAVPAFEIPIRAIFDPAEHMVALQQILATSL